MFTIKRNKLSDGTDAWDIDIHEHASNIFRYLINTSRTHWRKELEYSLITWIMRKRIDID